MDGKNGKGNEQQKLDYQEKYYNFFKNHVFYFPLDIPEDIIWDKDTIEKLIQSDKICKK